jgi:hypothetical protein
MLRCASLLPGFRRGRLAAYIKVRLNPRTGKDGSSTVPGLAAGWAASQLSRLACGLFYEAVRFRDALMIMCSKATLCLLVPFLATILALGGCAGLPSIKPLDPVLKPAVLDECRQPFLPTKYRLVHTLEAILPDGGKTTAIGVLVADPRSLRGMGPVRYRERSDPDRPPGCSAL